MKIPQITINSNSDSIEDELIFIRKFTKKQKMNMKLKD